MAVTRITPPAQLARSVTQDFLEEIHAAGTNGVPVARNGVPLKRQKFSCAVSLGALGVSGNFPWALGTYSPDDGTYQWSAQSDSMSANFDGIDYTSPATLYYNGRDKATMRSLAGPSIGVGDEFGDILDEPGGIYCYLDIGQPMSPWLGARTIVSASSEPPDGFPEGRWAIPFGLSLRPTTDGSSFPDIGATFRVDGSGWLVSDDSFRRIRRDGRTFSPWSLSSSADLGIHTDGWDSYRQQMGDVWDSCAAAARRVWLSVAAGVEVTLRVVDSADYGLGPLTPG